MKTYLSDKPWHNLLNHRRNNSRQHENGKDDVLESLLRGIGVEERKRDEKRRHNSKNELGVNILWHSPILGEDSLGDIVDL